MNQREQGFALDGVHRLQRARTSRREVLHLRQVLEATVVQYGQFRQVDLIGQLRFWFQIGRLLSLRFDRSFVTVGEGFLLFILIVSVI